MDINISKTYYTTSLYESFTVTKARIEKITNGTVWYCAAKIPEDEVLYTCAMPVELFKKYYKDINEIKEHIRTQIHLLRNSLREVLYDGNKVKNIDEIRKDSKIYHLVQSDDFYYDTKIESVIKIERYDLGPGYHISYRYILGSKYAMINNEGTGIGGKLILIKNKMIEKLERMIYTLQKIYLNLK